MPDSTAPLPPIKMSWIVWTLLAFGIFAVIAAYSSRMTDTYTDYAETRAAERYENLQKLRDEATQTLTTAAWVNQGKGIVRIPIDEAMTREIATLKETPAQPGGPIVVPAPPAVTPAPASTNAAPTQATPATNAAPAAPAKEAKK